MNLFVNQSPFNQKWLWVLDCINMMCSHQCLYHKGQEFLLISKWIAVWSGSIWNLSIVSAELCYMASHVVSFHLSPVCLWGSKVLRMLQELSFGSSDLSPGLPACADPYTFPSLFPLPIATLGKGSDCKSSAASLRLCNRHSYHQVKLFYFTFCWSSTEYFTIYF